MKRLTKRIMIALPAFLFYTGLLGAQNQDSVKKILPDSASKNKVYDKNSALDSARSHKMYKQIADSAKPKNHPNRKAGEPFDSLEIQKP